MKRYLPISDPPELRISMRAHLKAITSIAFMEQQNIFATASTDYSVRLWTLKGRFIGTFGQKHPWDIKFPLRVCKIITFLIFLYDIYVHFH